jgi:hypothetical protein
VAYSLQLNDLRRIIAYKPDLFSGVDTDIRTEFENERLASQCEYPYVKSIGKTQYSGDRDVHQLRIHARFSEIGG